jgi:male-specific lethal 3
LFYVAVSSTCHESCGEKNGGIKEHRQRRIKVKAKAVQKMFLL